MQIVYANKDLYPEFSINFLRWENDIWSLIAETLNNNIDQISRWINNTINNTSRYLENFIQ